MDIHVFAEFVLSIMGFVGIINKMPLMLKETNDVPIKTAMAQSASFVVTIICYTVLGLYMPAVVSTGIMIQWAIIGFRSESFEELLNDSTWFERRRGKVGRLAGLVS